MKPEWRWFMAINTGEDWLTLGGIASISFDRRLISGSLFFDLESFLEQERYASFAGTIDEDGEVITLEVESREYDVPSFTVSGQGYMEKQNSRPARTIILTDGTTVLGFSQFEKNPSNSETTNSQ